MQWESVVPQRQGQDPKFESAKLMCYETFVYTKIVCWFCVVRKLFPTHTHTHTCTSVLSQKFVCLFFSPRTWHPHRGKEDIRIWESQARTKYKITSTLGQNSETTLKRDYFVVCRNMAKWRKTNFKLVNKLE